MNASIISVKKSLKSSMALVQDTIEKGLFIDDDDQDYGDLNVQIVGGTMIGQGMKRASDNNNRSSLSPHY